jgi:hypothetical protein
MCRRICHMSTATFVLYTHVGCSLVPVMAIQIKCALHVDEPLDLCLDHLFHGRAGAVDT